MTVSRSIYKASVMADTVSASIEGFADSALAEVARRFSVKISPTMRAAIDETDASDPIALQFLPSVQELTVASGETKDPIADHPNTPVKGIVHRHSDRVLLKVLDVCPVYCRFCFRRSMVSPVNSQPLTKSELDAALSYIEETPSIWEVILTGGDPFLLSPARVAEIMDRLNAIPHVSVVRWHTRVPLVSPELVTKEFIQAMIRPNFATWVAIHTNHAKEFTTSGIAAVNRLVNAGIPLLGQTVLLKGVNDTPEALEKLLRTMIQNRIKPYYLHHLDKAEGTSHFRTRIRDGRELMQTLRGNLSGMCLPTYVLDLPSGGGKIAIPDYRMRMAENTNDNAADVYEFEAYDGVWNEYSDDV